MHFPQEKMRNKDRKRLREWIIENKRKKNLNRWSGKFYGFI